MTLTFIVPAKTSWMMSEDSPLCLVKAIMPSCSVRSRNHSVSRSLEAVLCWTSWNFILCKSGLGFSKSYKGIIMMISGFLLSLSLSYILHFLQLWILIVFSTQVILPSLGFFSLSVGSNIAPIRKPGEKVGLILAIIPLSGTAVLWYLIPNVSKYVSYIFWPVFYFFLWKNKSNPITVPFLMDE